MNAISTAQQDLLELERCGTLADTEPLARLLLRAEAVVRDGWMERTGFRAGSAGRQLIDLLAGTPVISIKTAQQMTGRSYPAVRNAVLALEEKGILRLNAKNRKSGIYVADDILNAFNRYERSLATLSGDTGTEKPRRQVPQRRSDPTRK